MTAPFTERLAGARAFVAAAKAGAIPPPPVHLADQLLAATEDAHLIALRLSAALRVVDPDRGWRSATGDACDPGEVDARIIAALAGCRLCPHLRRGPQPATVCLALRRVECARCRQTYRKPPADEDDRCDWCGARGASLFTPVAFQRGPLVVIGDACDACAAVLVFEAAP